ncbi:MAG: glycine--tRNA ligase, partial [Acidobacteriota bacterium]|nr:glycine--tRNA ligase [Acidobacteriota bacterium]
MSAPNIETIVSLSKRRGFVFPASEIYGGLGSSWDYGSLGVELANNIKRSWWRWLVHERDDIEGLDSSIIQNRLVWKYSGHETTFSDPLVDCRDCKSRFRADKLEYPKISDDPEAQKEFERTPVEQLIKDKKFPCPNCGEKDLTEPRPFNLM